MFVLFYIPCELQSVQKLCVKAIVIRIQLCSQTSYGCTNRGQAKKKKVNGTQR